MNIKTTKDDDPDYPWSAMLETNEIGTFFGYGKTEQEAIDNVKKTYKELTDE